MTASAHSDSMALILSVLLAEAAHALPSCGYLGRVSGLQSLRWIHSSDGLPLKAHPRARSGYAIAHFAPVGNPPPKHTSQQSAAWSPHLRLPIRDTREQRYWDSPSTSRQG